MIIVKGMHAVLEVLLNYKVPVHGILVASHTLNVNAEVLERAKNRSIHVEVVSSDQFRKRCPEKNVPQSVLAYVKSVKHGNFTDIVPENFPFVLMLDHLEDPYNFGAIIRSAMAFGVSTIIYPKDRQVDITSGVVRTSLGLIYNMHLVKVVNLGNTLKELINRGYWTYGASSREGVFLDAVGLRKPSVLVVGSENKGLTHRLQNIVQDSIKIPLDKGVESLNVSVATGILLYHFSNIN